MNLSEVTPEEEFDVACVKQEYSESTDFSGFPCLMPHSPSSSSSSPFSSMDEQNRIGGLFDTDAQRMLQ